MSSTFVVIIAVVVVVIAVARYDMKMPGAHARGLVVDEILLAQSCVVDVNNNTQCERKLVCLHMRGLTPTYDVVAAAAAVLSPSPSRVGRYIITKLVHSCTIGL